MSFPVYNGRLSVGDDVLEIGRHWWRIRHKVDGGCGWIREYVGDGGSVGASALGVRR